MDKSFENPGNPIEKDKNEESEPSLADSALCFRAFKIGSFDEKSTEIFKKQISMIEDFKHKIETQLSDKAPKTIVITNSDLEEAGRQEIRNSNLRVIFVDKAKAERRAKLATHLIGERSAAKGDFSYSDMLNAPSKEEDFSNSIFVSYDLVNKPEALIKQILGMKKIKDQFEKNNPKKLAIVGSAVEGVHVIELINKIIDGNEDINIENLSKIFHNNSLSLVDKKTKFSGIADNYLSGAVEVNEKQEPIGGNEDFLYGLKEILYHKKDCVLLINPHISGYRAGEMKGVESKYARRAAVYKLYARRALIQAGKRKVINLADESDLNDGKLNIIIRNMMDEHLFFASINSENKPEIILTSSQRSKKISAPF